MKKLFFTCLLFCISLYSNAQTTDLVIDCQAPGWLSSYISPNDINTVRNLKVIGEINQTDLATIGNLVKNYNLHGRLDLSEVGIVGNKLTGDMFGVNGCQLECFITPKEVGELQGCCDWVTLDTLIGGGPANPYFKFYTGDAHMESAKNGAYFSFTTNYFNAKHLILHEGTLSLTMNGYRSNGFNSPLKSITCPESMKTINGISYFKNLISLSIPENIEYLGSRTKTGLRVGSDTLFVPKSVKTFIDTWAYDDGYFEAYQGGGHIRCVYLPENLENLYLTYGCLHFGAKVDIHIKSKTPPTVPDGRFKTPTVIYVPVGCKDIYSNQLAWAEATIVEEIYAEKISISVPSVMYMNETYNLSADFTPANTTFKDVIWSSSDNTIVSISNSGVCKPITCGDVLISAENSDRSCKEIKTIRVYSHTSGVSISETSLTMKKGESQLLQASTLPLETSDGRIEWSTSNDKIAVVDNQGNISAIAKGKCVITATSVDGGYTAQCEVTVLQPVESLFLEKHIMPMKVGDTETMFAQVIPSSADDKTVTWSSSNKQIASVDANGNVTALKAGDAWIKAVSVDNAEAKDSCKVTVTQPVTGVLLSKENYTFDKTGESVQLTATVQPEDASNKEVRWSSSNENVCIVQNGLVTAVAAGTATVMVTTIDGNFTANCIVKVVQHVAKVEMNKTTLTLKVGEEEKLTATVSPDNAENKSLTWMSSNEKIATVDANGNVKALKAGEAWVKAVSVDNAEAKDSCKVTVTQPVTGITISQESIRLTNIGENKQLEATVLPEDASNKEVKWKSSNESICMVANGKVIATGFGTSVVMVTTVDGGFMASCTVTVESENTSIESVDVSVSDNPVYNMMGRKVTVLEKGRLYIRNGKKFIAK